MERPIYIYMCVCLSRVQESRTDHLKFLLPPLLPANLKLNFISTNCSIIHLQQLLAPLSAPQNLNTLPAFESQPARVTQATPIRPSEHPRPTPLPPALPAAALRRRNLSRNPWRRCVVNGGRSLQLLAINV